MGVKINYDWDAIHTITALTILAFVLPHLLVDVFRDSRARQFVASEIPETAASYATGALTYTLSNLSVVAVLAFAQQAPPLAKFFPAGSSFQYGKDRQCALSLTNTESGGFMNAPVLSG